MEQDVNNLMLAQVAQVVEFGLISLLWVWTPQPLLPVSHPPTESGGLMLM